MAAKKSFMIYSMAEFLEETYGITVATRNKVYVAVIKKLTGFPGTRPIYCESNG